MSGELSFPLSDLYSLSVYDLEDDNPLFQKIGDSFFYLKELLGFDCVDDLRTFFQADDFETIEDVYTFYGHIKCCPVSHRLFKRFTARGPSLQSLSAFYLSLNRALPGGLESVLKLPDNLALVILSLHLEMSSFSSTPGCNTHGSVSNCETLLITNFESVRKYLVELYSHVISADSDADPPWQQHPISDRLVENVQEALRTCSKEFSSFLSTVKLCVKVSKFFYDASEFVHAFRASYAIFKSVHAFSIASPDLETTTIRWEYEALCVMLQSMNAYAMYLDPDHRDILYKTAPQVLLRINRLGLSATSNRSSEEQLLASLPRGDNNSGFRRGLSTLSFSPGTMARIIYHAPDPSAGDSPSSSCSARRTQSEVCSKKSETIDSVDALSVDALNLERRRDEDCGQYYVSPVEVQAEDEDEGDDTELVHLLSVPLTITSSVSDSLPHQPICMAFGLAELGTFYYALCNYRLAFRFAMLALEQIKVVPCTSRVVVQVLRLACRICIIQRKYALGVRIIKWLAKFTREKLGSHNLLYANILLDYGCLLLNTDNTTKAAELYRIGLSMVSDCLPGLSVSASLALEDLAYAYYVLEYTSGEFEFALSCVDKAIDTLKLLGHQSCMQSASANRVKALILEEIAIDDGNPDVMHTKLMDARNLHLLSLDLCERTFGVWNIQTAKHFGNLGRLFQSLEHNQTAEEMHLKAIMIKERLLGPNDFEVGLSIGHLASLYNYHMNMYDKAEELYLRSIQISLDLFGPGYSGLEYDYRGLQRVYRKTNNAEKLAEYSRLFDEWMEHRLEHHMPEFMHFLASNETEHFEPNPPEGASLEQLVEDFRSEFDAKLGSTAEQSSTETVEVVGRTVTPTLEGEASRSTGL
ncbi:unnamed protein product [Hydatigera taeniaeformis]|uniref:TPR_REGION domain-containing protein n=1 Tax=Hydatigena taeniaeformis TaxID=6205 RepID=A0A0R3X5J9_HYDTA|nr:unnamed protein product [Hydatigera taeniaeformis]